MEYRNPVSQDLPPRYQEEPARNECFIAKYLLHRRTSVPVVFLTAHSDAQTAGKESRLEAAHF